jgi:Ni/Fe-hydrogenase 1 B-type cytochrome subunit
VIEVLKVDILLEKATPTETIGHNALASWSYLVVFLAFVFQAVTGFGLYAAMSTAWMPRLFAWIVPLMGGDFSVRQWHHVMMWFFVVFAMIHVYLVFYHDYVEERGEASSMLGGWKFEDERTPE